MYAEMGPPGCSTSFGIVDTTFLHICSDPAVRTPFGVYLVCVLRRWCRTSVPVAVTLLYQKHARHNSKNVDGPPVESVVGWQRVVGWRVVGWQRAIGGHKLPLAAGNRHRHRLWDSEGTSRSICLFPPGEPSPSH